MALPDVRRKPSSQPGHTALEWPAVHPPRSSEPEKDLIRTFWSPPQSQRALSRNPLPHSLCGGGIPCPGVSVKVHRACTDKTRTPPPTDGRIFSFSIAPSTARPIGTVHQTFLMLASPGQPANRQYLFLSSLPPWQALPLPLLPYVRPRPVSGNRGCPISKSFLPQTSLPRTRNNGLLP